MRRHTIRPAGPGLVLLVVLLAAPFAARADIQLFGGNPLLNAIMSNDVEQVRSRLTHGDNAEVEDFDHRRPLIYAASLGNADIVEMLIRRKVDLNHRDNLGNSALFYAATDAYLDIVEMLLDAGADKDIENRQGLTPLMAAASKGHVQVVEIMLARGADATRHDYTGRTALMWAEWNRRANVVAAMRKAGVRE